MGLFWSTFFLMLAAEIADKSRIAGFLLATTYRAPWAIFWGMTLGYALLDGIAVVVGETLSSYISPYWLKLASSLIFMGLGVMSFFIGEHVEEQGRKWLDRMKNQGPFFVSFLAIGLSEIGDRTQLAAATLSAETGRPLVIFSGTLSAMALLNLITVWIGDKLAHRVPARLIHAVSGIGFFLVGLFLLIQIIRSG